MSKYDNCPSDASSDFKEGYEDGYEESWRRHGNDIVPIHSYPDRLRDGFKAGKRQAKRDLENCGPNCIAQFGCLLGIIVIVIPCAFFDWPFYKCLVAAIVISIIGGILHEVDTKRNRRIKKDATISGCGCAIAIGIMIVAFVKGFSCPTAFIIGVAVMVIAMIIDAYSSYHS